MSIPASIRSPRAGQPDLRLAESYLPGVATWFKGLVYTTSASFVLYGQMPTQMAACFVVCLYLDHLYLSWPASFLDSTTVGCDVLGATIAASLLNVEWVWCCAPGAAWTVVGIGHLVWKRFPLCLAHVMMGGLLLTSLALAPKREVLAGQSADAVLSPFFLRSFAYMALVLCDAYLLPSRGNRNRRLCLVRYGGVLFVPWQMCIACRAVLLGTQAFLLRNTTQTGKAADCEAPSAAATTSARLFPGIVHPPPPMVAASAASNPNDLDVLEAFKLAKQQYNLGSSANKTC